MRYRGMWGLVTMLGLACDSAERPGETVTPAPAGLVRVDDEAAGSQCALGGRAIRRGPDRDGDGQLSDDEVDAVDYVCRSEAPSPPPLPPPAEPAVLLTQTPEAPGANCSAGGMLVRAGADTNGNGVLEDVEVTRSFYGCQAASEAPLAVLTREKKESAGVHCAEGGVAIQAGADRDRDGALSDGEVETTSYVCGEPERPVLTKTVALAAGTECPLGGSRVLAGRDDNANNLLEASEVETTLTLCRERQEGWTHSGDYRIRDATDVTALAGVGHISGALRVEESTLEQINLPLLKTVRGLVIQKNSLLKRLSTDLRFVDGVTLVRDNPLLEYVDMDGGQLRGDVLISRNERLASLSFASLTDITGNVVVEDNASMTSLHGLDSVRRITGNLTVKNNPSLVSSGWSPGSALFSGPLTLQGQLTVVQNPKLSTFATELEFVGQGLTFQDNPKLWSLRVQDLPWLPGSLVLRGNPLLNTLSGLESLRGIGGDLHLEGMQQLEVLHLDALEHVGGDFRFIDNDALYGFTYLKKLVSIGGSLTLKDNALLYDPAFLSLRSVNEGVFLERNANLTHVGGLSSLSTLQYLEVRDNPKLLRLTGLADLRSAYSVVVSGNPELFRLDLAALTWSQYLTITNNTKLPTCLATALRAQVQSHLIDSTISGNLEPSTCP